MPKNRKRCFVIMPFSKTSEEHTEEYWTNHFETFLKPLIEESKELEAHRSEPLRGDILKQIITELVTTPVVVADLTDRNPNVFWELGVRQSFKHCTITIAEKGTKVPFDVSVKGTPFYYPKDHIKNAKFTKKFKKAIEDCLSQPDSPDSHVLETISGRGTLFEIIHRDEAIRRVKALLLECFRNQGILNAIYATIKKNRKNPKKRTFITHRLLSSAIELLLTTRYLDGESRFYDLAMGCVTEILARNEQLNAWQFDPDATEEWFMKTTVRRLRRKLNEFGEELTRIEEKLSASL